jgi:hypothetical protein
LQSLLTRLRERVVDFEATPHLRSKRDKPVTQRFERRRCPAGDRMQDDATSEKPREGKEVSPHLLGLAVGLERGANFSVKRLWANADRLLDGRMTARVDLEP